MRTLVVIVWVTALAFGAICWMLDPMGWIVLGVITPIVAYQVGLAVKARL